MPSPWKRPPFRLGLAAALLLAAGAPAQPPETFTGQLVIREREVVIDLPENVADDALAPGDFQVLVDGRPREVARAAPAGREEAWTLVIYVDRVLADPATAFYSTLSLANHAGELTRLGNVEVVQAASDPVAVLPSTRETHPVHEALANLSAEARVERDHAEALGPKPPSPLQVRRQLEKLVTFLASRRPSGPHAVFLVADGIELSPEQTALLESREAPASGLPADLRGVGRALSAYGWVTVVLPLRKEEIGRRMSMMSDTDRTRMNSRGPNDPPVILVPPKATTLAYEGVVDLFLKPRTAGLRALARATTGTVVAFEEQLGPLLAALDRRRWRLWIDEPGATVDGRLHSIQVSLPGKRKEVRAQEWIRSSTPEEVSTARLENLLAGARDARDAGGLPLAVSAAATPAGLELRLKIAPFEAPESAPAGPVRISWAFPGPDGATGVHHEAVPAGELAKGWSHTAHAGIPLRARSVAVVVEALGPERWGGTVVGF
ncbi:MAG: hypothetical protein ACJ75H_25060 [Thermoanaerobaculia bacterium]